ncbi:MAG: HAMP domain-containing histidine kinase, partial [Holosporaceae bacterium]|nr:HAMP domain-containing histidine kinase [Holosporaceae bacterium]
MISDRYVKWSDEALDFFKSSADKSVVLDVVISYACASQTGEGFADLVNSLNSEEVKRKIKKVVITDTCCLYRHCISGFDKYLDANVPTVWFLTNKDAIGRIECEIEMKSWSDGIKGEEFEYWHKKMLTDFAGDENGNGAIREFRDKVIEEAAVAAYKGNSELSGCIDFMLEECAYVCAHFKNNPIFVYPMRLARPMTNAIERYNMSVTHLPYKTSKQSQKSCKKVSNLDSDRIDKEVALFMKERVSNVNFFVIDKYGNHIYKNYTLDRVIGDNNAKELGQKIWQTNAEVMRTREQIVCEEYYNGINYLSVKSPLIIDDEVIGIIGLALDITGQKKAQQLELKNKMQQVKIQEQQKLKVLAEQVAHDIRSPLMALDMLSRSHKNLSEKERGILASIATNVSDIANNLLNRYKKSDDEKNVEIDKKSRPILVNLALSEIISHKKYQYQKVNVQFNCLFGPKTSFIFINGNQSDFSRMTSNVINNAVEALEGKDGAIDINVRRNGAYVDVIIGDNGKGMPQETIDKILGNVFVGTAKEGGYGIGLNQIR